MFRFGPFNAKGGLILFW